MEEKVVVYRTVFCDSSSCNQGLLYSCGHCHVMCELKLHSCSVLVCHFGWTNESEGSPVAYKNVCC